MKAVVAAGLMLLVMALGRAEEPGFALVLDIRGAIGPATSDYVVRGLEDAAERGAKVVILRMDTPGGLDTSMREIIRAILAAPLPVVGYVAPSGARAASAGTYILYASAVAAMAPGTNLGAATPIQIGGPGLPRLPGGGDENGDRDKKGGEEKEKGGKEAKKARKPAHPGLPEKAISDAVAYLRSLAELRGRNAEWAEKAVREAASLSAEEALKEGVIDLIAADIPDLLKRIDGREVTLGSRKLRLATAELSIAYLEPDWRTELLAIVTNPNVAYILMLIGIYGLLFEFYSPGLIGPGVVGSICLVLALYAFHMLPVNYAGLALAILGIGLMIAETFTPTFGVLGVGGIAAFVIGSVMLMETNVPGFQVAWQLVGGIALVAAIGVLTMIALLLRARRRAVVTGAEEMLGSTGSVIEWAGREGQVRIHGEIWQARCAAALVPGQRVRVVAIEGLTVVVEPEQTGRTPSP